MDFRAFAKNKKLAIMPIRVISDGKGRLKPSDNLSVIAHVDIRVKLTFTGVI